MVFSSILFLFYFLPAFLCVYFLIDKRHKNLTILLFSIFFYAWGAPKFIFVILLTTCLDFYLVRWMDKVQNIRRKRILLIASLSLNLGLLFYFKYFNFFIDNTSHLLQSIGLQGVTWPKILLPIGISFYTFESITYVVDVYRKVHKPLSSFLNYQLYILFFPKLIAGPVVRYHDMAEQLENRSHDNQLDNRLTGFYRFSIGLAKKMILANQLGAQADYIFAQDYSTLGSYAAWFGIIAYTFQIYFDFSGYSDMAIGLARMIGFKLPENFNNPYIAQSITEFWRRWHITLGAWMKNYLYIPLGGNRLGNSRTYMNLWLVFIASGFWHGASWGFVFWGAYHGFFLVMERLFLIRWFTYVGSFLRMTLTFIFVAIGWIFFRADSLTLGVAYFKQLGAFHTPTNLSFSTEFYLILCLAVLFSFFTFSKLGLRIHDLIFSEKLRTKNHLLVFSLVFPLFLLSVAKIAGVGFNPFIYFRF